MPALTIRPAQARALLAGVLAVAVVACGGSGSGEAVRAQARTSCAEAAEQLEVVAWPAEEDLTLRTASTALAATAQVHRDLIAVLEGLADDSAGGRAVRELAESARPIVDALEDAERRAAAGDSAGFDAAMGTLVQAAAAARDASIRLDLLPCYDAELE